MSACRVCGKDDGEPNATFCPAHDAAFHASPEWLRFGDRALSFDAGMVALMDFINRALAEHQNGRGDASGT